MDYCGPAGIPHSTFLAWSDLDRAKALAWQRREGERCPSCGMDHTAPDGTRYDERSLPWRVEHHTCPSCRALALSVDPVGDKDARPYRRQRFVPLPASGHRP